MMMKGLYDISKYVFLRVFKNFLKVVRVGKKWSEGVKNGVKWGKKLVPISAFIHYLRGLMADIATAYISLSSEFIVLAIFM